MGTRSGMCCVGWVVWASAIIDLVWVIEVGWCGPLLLYIMSKLV